MLNIAGAAKEVFWFLWQYWNWKDGPVRVPFLAFLFFLRVTWHNGIFPKHSVFIDKALCFYTDIFCITVLFSYNSCTVNFTFLKCTLHGFSISTGRGKIPEHLHLSPKKLSISSFPRFPLLQAPSNRWSTFCVCNWCIPDSCHIP